MTHDRHQPSMIPADLPKYLCMTTSLSPTFSGEASNGLFIEESTLDIVLLLFMMDRLFFTEDLQGLLRAMLRLKVLACLPFAQVPRVELGARLVVVALRIAPEGVLPSKRYRIDDPCRRADKAHQALPCVLDLLFLLPALARSLPQVLPGALGLVPAQLEDALQRKAEFLSCHPAL